MGDLLGEQLLPMAESALLRLGIPEDDVSGYLDIAKARVSNRQTGARWQRDWVAKHGADWAGLTRAYVDAQESGEPVHAWPKP